MGEIEREGERKKREIKRELYSGRMIKWKRIQKIDKEKQER